MKILLLISVITAFSISCIFSQNIKQVDKRALSVYSEKEINEMPVYKILQINYLYNESFIIPDEMKSLVSPADVNIGKYSAHRKEKERVKIDLDIEKKSGMYIILLSHAEIGRIMKEIENSSCVK